MINEKDKEKRINKQRIKPLIDAEGNLDTRTYMNLIGSEASNEEIDKQVKLAKQAKNEERAKISRENNKTGTLEDLGGGMEYI